MGGNRNQIWAEKHVPFEKLYGTVMFWRESYTKEMVIVGCLLHRPGDSSQKVRPISFNHLPQSPLGVTCPIFSDDAFYIEAGIHPGIAAVKLECFDGDNSVEAAILPQLKKEHKGKSPFFSRFGKLFLNLH